MKKTILGLVVEFEVFGSYCTLQEIESLFHHFQPKLDTIPQGDWYCTDCIIMVS
jgi:hypothetical protein